MTNNNHASSGSWKEIVPAIPKSKNKSSKKKPFCSAERLPSAFPDIVKQHRHPTHGPTSKSSTFCHSTSAMYASCDSNMEVGAPGNRSMVLSGAAFHHPSGSIFEGCCLRTLRAPGPWCRPLYNPFNEGFRRISCL